MLAVVMEVYEGGKDVDGRQLRVEKASAGGTRDGGGGRSRGFGASSRGGRW